LDDLLAQAGHYAGFCMRNSGRVAPALFLLGPEGLLMFAPESLADDRAKDDFATAARLICIAHAATACVLVMEAWAKFARPGEQLDLTEPPSEAFDRQEFVVLMGESRVGVRQRLLPIIRTDAGGFFGFGEPNEPDADQMTGRFAQLLPSRVPDEAIRQLARAALRARGIAPGAAGRRPRR
jgi:hypothetical protein